MLEKQKSRPNFSSEAFSVKIRKRHEKDTRRKQAQKIHVEKEGTSFTIHR
jgi:hypothetical protein